MNLPSTYSNLSRRFGTSARRSVIIQKVLINIIQTAFLVIGLFMVSAVGSVTCQRGSYTSDQLPSISFLPMTSGRFSRFSPLKGRNSGSKLDIEKNTVRVCYNPYTRKLIPLDRQRPRHRRWSMQQQLARKL